jgi:hypothetical protein
MGSLLKEWASKGESEDFMSLFDQRNPLPRWDRLTVFTLALLGWVVVAASTFVILAPRQF